MIQRVNIRGLRAKGDVTISVVQEERGPCHDFCSCRYCWRGWSGIPFRTRLRWRLAYIWRVTIVRRQAW